MSANMSSASSSHHSLPAGMRFDGKAEHWSLWKKMFESHLSAMGISVYLTAQKAPASAASGIKTEDEKKDDTVYDIKANVGYSLLMQALPIGL